MHVWQGCACVLLAWAGVGVPQALADVWTYVDDKGVAHFASYPMDERYQLFFKEPPAPKSELAVPPAPQPPGPPPSPAIVAFMDRIKGFHAVKHHVRAAAETHRVDYELLQALIATESGFNPKAVSPKGAVGLMQIMPKTARRYGVQDDRRMTVERKLTDPQINIATGTRYLRDLLDMFPNKTELAVAAYNAGEDAVQRAGNKIPNYPETQNYVKTVMQLYHGLKPSVVTAPAPPGRLRTEPRSTSTPASHATTPRTTASK